MFITCLSQRIFNLKGSSDKEMSYRWFKHKAVPWTFHTSVFTPLPLPLQLLLACIVYNRIDGQAIAAPLILLQSCAASVYICHVLESPSACAGVSQIENCVAWPLILMWGPWRCNYGHVRISGSDRTYCKRCNQIANILQIQNTESVESKKDLSIWYYYLIRRLVTPIECY